MNILFSCPTHGGSSSQLCRVHLCPRKASTSRHRVRSVANVLDKYWRRHRTLLAMSQAFICWIIHRDSPRLLQQPVAIRHMTVWQRRTSCSMKLPLSYLPWKLRTPRRNSSCKASTWARINLDQKHDLLISLLSYFKGSVHMTFLWRYTHMLIIKAEDE